MKTGIRMVMATIMTMRRCERIWVAMTVVVVFGSASSAGATAEQACQNGRYLAAAKYAACEQRATGTQFSGGFSNFQGAVSKCRAKYTAAWIKLQAKGGGTGSTCDQPRLDDNGDGTVTDRLTGLQWERKTDDGSVHDKDNLYTWSAGGAGFAAADGTVFTSMLAVLNGTGGGCFGGHCDWRLPTRGELQTILAEAYPCALSPCIDAGAFGPTVPDDYWAATTNALNASNAWSVDFTDGFVSNGTKSDVGYARAVRGGL